MKKIKIVTILFCCLLGACGQASKYIINGKTMSDDLVVVLVRVNPAGKADTLQQVTVKDKQFQMTGPIEKPAISFLSIIGGKGRIPVLLEDTVFNIEIRKNDVTDIRNFTASGGNYQQKLNDFYKKELEVFQDRDSVIASYIKAEKEHDIATKMGEAFNLQLMADLYDKEENKCIEENKDNILGLCLIYKRLPFLKFENLKVKFETLGDSMKQTPEGKIIEQKYKILGETKVGGKAPDFTLNSLNGSSVNLYELEGKIKIIDFWASWCAPCRRENPHLVELYKKYKEQGLQILSVSMDTNKEAWAKAVKADGMDWLQVSDLKGAAGAVAQKYKIKGIPHIFVLDSNNKIIGEKIKGKELDELLEKYFKKK